MVLDAKKKNNKMRVKILMKDQRLVVLEFSENLFQKFEINLEKNMRQPLCLLLMSDKFSKKIDKKSINDSSDPLKDQKNPEPEQKHHYIHSEIKADFAELGLKIF